MQRRIIVVFLSLFWLVLSQACAAERGALFKVTGKGHTMYLFGTMHVGLAEFYPLEPRIVQAVRNAPTLALEIDPGVPPEVIGRLFVKYGVADPAVALPAALAARLERVMKEAKLDAATTAPLKPWAVAMILAVQQYLALGFKAELAVDSHLAALARSAKTKVVALESAETQMALFSGLSQADQLRFLDDTLTLIESGKQRAEALKIVDAWRNADQAGLDAVAAQLESDTTFAGRFMQKVVLEGRNGAIADKLLALLEREDQDVAAIGLLHLIGKNSVPALMRARGVAVERVY